MKIMKIFRNTALGFACRLVMLTVLLLVGGASVGMYAEVKPWAKYADGTLTFYYSEKSSLGTDEYELNSGYNTPGWNTDHQKDITKVVFDESFKEARPTSCYEWFANCENIEKFENLQYLNTSEVTNMKRMFRFLKKITELDVSHFDTQKVTDMNRLFTYIPKVTKLDVSHFDTRNVTDMHAMFYNIGCSQLDVSNFDTKNVKSMNQMFAECRKLTSLNLKGKFSTVNVTTLYRMFYNSYALKTIDLSNFNTEKGPNMEEMFARCISMESIDLSSFNTGNVVNMSSMFSDCSKLKAIYASDKFTTDNVTSSNQMFYNCFSLSGDIEHDQNYVDKTYAKIDGGYFRDKAYANRPWAKYADGTLTFSVSEYKKTIDGSNGEYELNTGDNVPGWYTDHKTDITKVVFDESFKIVHPTTGHYWFSYCENLVTIENISNLNTSEMTDMTYMFYRCKKLQSLDVSNFNTENVTDMSNMFRKCENLQSLDVSNFNTAKVKNMDNMFAECSGLQSLDLSKFNTENVTNMKFMFYWCDELLSLDVTNFNTAKVENMKGMFYSCSKIQSIDVSSFNTKNVTDMYKMFFYCNNMQSLDLSNFNTESVTNMEDMFGQCRGLQSLDLSSFNTANVTDMSYMFEYCSKLKSIYASDKFTTSNVTSSSDMFYSCTSLSGDKEFDQNYVDKTYAKIDGGYFRDKAYPNRPWAKYADGTLTFLYGYKKTIDGSNGEYELNTGEKEPGWLGKNSSITKVVFDESFKNARPTTGYKWFSDYWKLTEIENISYLNTSEMTDMGYMFTGCSSLQSLDLSSFNTANVESMINMFYKCSKLQSLDLSNFNTAKVADMRKMFYTCSKLQSIIISKDFTTKSVKYTTAMFDGCYARLYTTMADYMARSDNKTIDGKVINPYFPINAKAEYGTLCSPVGGTLGEGSFYGFDKLYEVDADKTDDTKVVMKEVTEIEAGKPYIYRRNLTDSDPVASAIVFNIDKNQASAPQNLGMLKGTFESMIAPGGSYILQTDGMFHRVSDSNATLKVGAYRAYLDLSTAGNEARTISMSFDDSETTGIREVYASDCDDTPIYDLTGRRINTPQRGQIYIQNGKKRVANF